MTYQDQLAEQSDSLQRDIASRILKDVNRKKRVIILIPGTAMVAVDYPKISISSPDDILRVGTQLSQTGLALCQCEGQLIMVIERFAQIIGARIYGLTDLPDLSISPSDQLMMNSYEPVSYHELPLILAHVLSTATNQPEAGPLSFEDVKHG